MRVAGVFERLSVMGAAAQASVPGLYAWGVTVAPAAWARGASSTAKVAAVVALLSLAAGVLGELRWGGGVRFASLWGFVLASGLTWSAAPAALGPLRIDAPRGIAGMIGWALFALASAAPSLEGRRGRASVIEEPALSPRKGLAPGDAAYVAAGTLLAAALQVVGWRVATAERALLVRFVALAAGLAVLGASTDVALARHGARQALPRRARLRSAMAMLVVFVLLAATGALFAYKG
jgi:hypothetical protein